MFNEAKVVLVNGKCSVGAARRIADELLPAYSYVYLVLPDGIDEPLTYSQESLGAKYPGKRVPITFTNAQTTDNIPNADDNPLVLVFELEVNEEVTRMVEGRLDDSVVTPSACLLEGKISRPSTKRAWIAFRWVKGLTRNGLDEGLIQWAHQLLELAFLVGTAPKYGD